MTPMSFEPVDKFLTRVRKASATGGKSVNLSIEEAAELAAVIGQMAIRIKTPAPAVAQPETIELEIRGGEF